MKKILGIFSLFTITSSQLFGGTFLFSNLSKDEQKILKEKHDNVLIQYDESTDEIVIDEALERELRESGILKTEDAKKGTVCIGD
ncbi:MAG: hypothetical protein ACXVLQ_18585, partial [Bacteriovorax sp.]